MGLYRIHFSLENGTGQGCALSPLLYILTMVHLARTIRDNRDIREMQMGEECHKVSLFTDELLVLLSDPLVALLSLME